VKILYVGYILPMEVSSALEVSIAATKFEHSFVRSLDEELDGSVDILSFAGSGHAEIRRNNIREVYEGKPFTHIVPSTKPILGDVVRDFIFLVQLLKWSVRNIRHRKAILIINSPCGICGLSLLAKPFGVKIVSFTIDTPFTPSNKFEGLCGRYAKRCFALGHRMLRHFSGIIVHNEAAVARLGLRIPYFVTAIGYDEEAYDGGWRKAMVAADGHAPWKIVYAGTLIDYNGVLTLAAAFQLLDQEKFVLHIYGSGPLEREIRKYAQANSNIIFHGIIANDEVLKVFAEADLLVNPRVTAASVCDFAFPSKMTEYVLSGTPVLTTNFSSMPQEYRKFVFVVEDESPEGFSAAIERVFRQDPSELEERCNRGVTFVRQHQSWRGIARNVCAFLASL
jgi:glycosyltransferase involved in cell wall biosynthesis